VVVRGAEMLGLPWGCFSSAKFFLTGHFRDRLAEIAQHRPDCPVLGQLAADNLRGVNWECFIARG
jgi:hypothetical protein